MWCHSHGFVASCLRAVHDNVVHVPQWKSEKSVSTARHGPAVGSRSASMCCRHPEVCCRGTSSWPGDRRGRAAHATCSTSGQPPAVARRALGDVPCVAGFFAAARRHANGGPYKYLGRGGRIGPPTRVSPRARPFLVCPGSGFLASSRPAPSFRSISPWLPPAFADPGCFRSSLVAIHTGRKDPPPALRRLQGLYIRLDSLKAGPLQRNHKGLPHSEPGFVTNCCPASDW